MSIDAGTQQITRFFASRRNADDPVGVQVGGSLELQVGRLADMIDRQMTQAAAFDRLDAQIVAPVNLGPLDFIVTGGQPKLKTHRSTTSDNMSPQEGFLWFVTRLTLSGLNAGDLVNLHRPTSGGIMVNATAVHQFAGPTGSGAGLGIADWEPGALGMMLWPDDTLNLVSGGTLAATEIILTGQGIQVATLALARYLL